MKLEKTLIFGLILLHVTLLMAGCQVKSEKEKEAITTEEAMVEIDPKEEAQNELFMELGLDPNTPLKNEVNEELPKVDFNPPDSLPSTDADIY